MKNKYYSTPQYQRFCRIVCPGLILLGLVLLAISYRTSQFTCARSTGMCTISYSGILPTPKISFGLGYLGRVLVEWKDGCCTSDNPQLYNLTIEAGGLDKSYRLLHGWITDKRSYQMLWAAADKIDQFMRNSTIPEVSISLPDNRQEDFFCGLFFLIAGLIYSLINLRVIFPGYQHVLSKLASLVPGLLKGSPALDGGLPGDEVPPEMAGESPFKKERFGSLAFLWLWWFLIPPFLPFLLLGIIRDFHSFFTPIAQRIVQQDPEYSDNALEGIVNTIVSLLLAYIIAKLWNTDRKALSNFRTVVLRIFCTVVLVGLWILVLASPEGAVLLMILVFFFAQAWLIKRLGMNGYGWIAVSITGLFVGIILMAFLPYRWPVLHDYWSRYSYSQGRLSIGGLLFGVFISFLQPIILRRRAAHASWWILGSALTCEVLFVVPKLAVALFPQLQNWWEMVANQVYNSMRYIDLQYLVILICFSAIQGAMLLWMVKKDPVGNSPNSHELPKAV